MSNSREGGGGLDLVKAYGFAVCANPSEWGSNTKTPKEGVLLASLRPNGLQKCMPAHSAEGFCVVMHAFPPVCPLKIKPVELDLVKAYGFAVCANPSE